MKKTILPMLLLLLAFAADAQEKIQPTGMFSDMSLHQGSGDLIGTEIFITYGGGLQYYAQIQIAEGEPAPPQLVKIKLDGNKVSFDWPEELIETQDRNHKVLHFQGEISRDRLVGTLDGVSSSINLPRRKSYWQ
jgi:hypothetical protein